MNTHPRLTRSLLALGIASTFGGGLGAVSQPASAQDSARLFDFDLPAQPLSAALAALSRQTGAQVVADGALVANRQAPAIRGSLSVTEALQRLLQGSGLVFRGLNSNSFVIQSAPPDSPAAATTLSRIRVVEEEQAAAFKGEVQEGATKTELSLRETPQAISVVTQQSIETRQARDLTTALELTPGINSANGSNGGPFSAFTYEGGESYSMRGQLLDGNRDVRIDGFATGAANNVVDLALFERVEVIKGPSSTLYGQGSLGGFINMVRKKPLAEPTARLTARAGSYDTYRAEADVTGSLGTRSVLGRVVTVFEDAGSFIDGSESQREVVAPSIAADLGDAAHLTLELLYQNDTFIPTSGFPLVQAADGSIRLPNVDRSFVWGVPAQQDSEARTLDARMRLDYQVNDDWLATLLLQDSRQKQISIFDSYGFNSGAIDDSGDSAMYAGFYRSNNDDWAGELRVTGRFDAFGREHDLLLGVEKNRRENRYRAGFESLGIGNIYAEDFREVGTAPGQSTPVYSDEVTTSSNEGAYAQLMLRLLDRTRVVAGVRRDATRKETHSNIAETRDASESNAWVPRVGVMQDLMQNVTAYVSYAESFTPTDAITREGKILDAITGSGYEAGLKSEWLDGRLGGTLAVYRQDLDNVPLSDPNNGPGESFSISGGLQRTEGVEIEVAGTAFTGFTLAAAASWLDAKYLDRRDPLFGLTPRGTVAEQYALFASYELQSGPLRGVAFGVTAIKLGRRSISYSDEQYVPGYERFDLQVSYSALPQLDLSLQVRNVADRTYLERFRQAGYGNYFGAPRALLLRMDYRLPL